jgi:hypothetical protein
MGRRNIAMGGIVRIGTEVEVAVLRVRDPGPRNRSQCARLDLSLVAQTAARIAWLAAGCGIDLDRIERIVHAAATGTDGIVDVTVEADADGPGMTIGLYEQG